ncbi:MAG: hypothetical protein WBC20_08450 [Candidatus Aminicenantaceae bacterium]
MRINTFILTNKINSTATRKCSGMDEAIFEDLVSLNRALREPDRVGR